MEKWSILSGNGRAIRRRFQAKTAGEGCPGGSLTPGRAICDRRCRRDVAQLSRSEQRPASLRYPGCSPSGRTRRQAPTFRERYQASVSRMAGYLVTESEPIVTPTRRGRWPENSGHVSSSVLRRRRGSATNNGWRSGWAATRRWPLNTQSTFGYPPECHPCAH